MFGRVFLTMLIMAVFAASAAVADGGFYGEITYLNCDCQELAYGDKVIIKAVGGFEGWAAVSCRWTQPGYNSASTYPPEYYIRFMSIWAEDQIVTFPR